jgi:hypothetical protein
MGLTKDAAPARLVAIAEFRFLAGLLSSFSLLSISPVACCRQGLDRLSLLVSAREFTLARRQQATENRCRRVSVERIR